MGRQTILRAIFAVLASAVLVLQGVGVASAGQPTRPAPDVSVRPACADIIWCPQF